MNHEVTQIENQLLSWKPRPPSATLKQRLFPQGSSLRAAKPLLPGVGELHLPPFAIGRWLAPAMAIFVLCVIYLGNNSQYGGHLGYKAAPGIMATVSICQPNLGVSYASANPSERNVWSVTTFDWTNVGQSLSTALPVLRRNDLTP